MEILIKQYKSQYQNWKLQEEHAEIFSHSIISFNNIIVK